MSTAYDFDATTIDGAPLSLGTFQGKVLLIVNVASACGYTRQYSGLQALSEKYADAGLVVLGFPCDQFGHQEPGTEEEIKAFCSTTFAVTFPMFAKIEVNGEGAHPLYRWLEQQAPGPKGADIRWNFTKFLVGPDGAVAARFESNVEPEDLVEPIEQLLGHDALGE